jgi:aquaporin Z
MSADRYAAETIGTFALVFAGCGAIVVNDTLGGALGHVGVSLVFGLVIMVMIYAVGNVSGAHFNPVVTLGATLPTGGIWRAFVMEVVLSFLLMFVILNVSTGHKEKGIMAGVAIGGTVALTAGQLRSVWIYVLAPVVGAFLAHPACWLIQGEACCDLLPGLGEEKAS